MSAEDKSQPVTENAPIGYHEQTSLPERQEPLSRESEAVQGVGVDGRRNVQPTRVEVSARKPVTTIGTSPERNRDVWRIGTGERDSTLDRAVVGLCHGVRAVKVECQKYKATP